MRSITHLSLGSLPTSIELYASITNNNELARSQEMTVVHRNVCVSEWFFCTVHKY